MAGDGCCSLESLPSVVLLQILKYLSPGDLIALSEANTSLSTLCCEGSVVRYSKFEGCYWVREEDLKNYIASNHASIRRLDFNHCYWLPQRALQSAVVRCKNLQELHVVECRIRTETLVGMIAAFSNLVALSMSISSFSNIKKDVFLRAQEVLRSLKRLFINFSGVDLGVIKYLGEHPTLLDFCPELEELSIGSVGMAVSELYRPIISIPSNHVNLKVMRLASNIHAGAQMFFYGTLSQLPNSELRWRALLMPNVNFEEFCKKADFKNCLHHISQLRALDMSGSKIKFPNDLVNVEQLTELRYLNLRSTQVSSQQLQYIAVHCRKLQSLNLHSCSHVLHGELSQDLSGLQTIFLHCHNLHHLNLAGGHHHLHPPLGSTQVAKLFEIMKSNFFIKMKQKHAEEFWNFTTDSSGRSDTILDLESLAVPSCMLCGANTITQRERSGKRVMSSSGPGPSKRRCGYVTGAAVSQQSRSPESESGSSSSSDSSSSSGPQEPPLVMYVLARNCQGLRELEIISVKFDSFFQKNRFINPKTSQFNPCTETRLVRDSDLAPIQHIKCLRKLTLAGLPGLLTGQSLIDICKNCQHLQTLSLAYLGGSTFGSALTAALPHCKQLRDLRLEQPYLTLNGALFGALGQCNRLQRLCIMSKHSAFQPKDIMAMMDKLSHLMVLQLFAGGTISCSKSLASSLNKRYGKGRPAFSVTIYPLMYDGVTESMATIPAKHMDELTRFDSRVCLLPSDY